jgi:DNA-binding CsgD family transcriptional regulator
MGASHVLPPTDLPHLSPRQCEVLFWAAHGKSAWVTARLMGLKEPTVKSYIADACAKLGAGNKTHAVAICVSRGFFIV